MQQLFKSQFMLVRWQQYISHYVSWLDQDTEDKMTESDREILEIELDIVLQINWWLKSFSRLFSIGKLKVPDHIPTPIENDNMEGITLTDWRAWREFYDILRDIGYPLSEDKWIESVSWYSIITEWIQKIYPDRQYVYPN